MKKIFLICLLSTPFFIQAMETQPEQTGQTGQKEDTSGGSVDLEMGSVGFGPKLEVAPSALCTQCEGHLGTTNSLLDKMHKNVNISNAFKVGITTVGLPALWWLAHSLHRTANALEGGICNN